MNIIPPPVSSPESPTSRCCDVEGCTFTYLKTQPTDLKTHKKLSHVLTVRVTFEHPTEEVVLTRIGDSFQCLRCAKLIKYPSGMQVS